jgi:integrase
MEHIVITDALVKSIGRPDRTRLIMDDHPKAPKGLGLRILPSGSMAWTLTYRPRRGAMAGRERRMVIAQAGPQGISVSTARKIGQRLRDQVVDGRDPLGERQADRRAVEERANAPTMRNLSARYLWLWARRHKRRSSAEDDRSMIDQHVIGRLSQRDKERGRKPHKILLGDMPVADVRKEHIEALYREIMQRWHTRSRANATLALLSKMFSLAREWNWIAVHPVKGIRRGPTVQRERFLDAHAELPRFLRALDSLNDRSFGAADAIRFMLLTGCRKGEAIRARWPEFDLSSGIWTKPATRTKQQKTHRLPLAPPAIRLLQRLREQADDGLARAVEFERQAKREQDTWKKRALLTHARLARAQASTDFVFPSAARPGQAIENVRATFRRVCKEAAIKGLRPHDLRHSHASYLISEGYSLKVVSELLGHASVATSNRYSHLADDTARSAAGSVGKVISLAERKLRARR